MAGPAVRRGSGRRAAAGRSRSAGQARVRRDVLCEGRLFTTALRRRAILRRRGRRHGSRWGPRHLHRSAIVRRPPGGRQVAHRAGHQVARDGAGGMATRDRRRRDRHGRDRGEGGAPAVPVDPARHDGGPAPCRRRNVDHGQPHGDSGRHPRDVRHRRLRLPTRRPRPGPGDVRRLGRLGGDDVAAVRVAALAPRRRHPARAGVRNEVERALRAGSVRCTDRVVGVQRSPLGRGNVAAATHRPARRADRVRHHGRVRRRGLPRLVGRLDRR